jgi:hypothetical protein
MKYWIQGQQDPLSIEEIANRPELLIPTANCAPVGTNEWRPLIEVVPQLFDQSGCGAMILPMTAERTGGICMPCKKELEWRKLTSGPESTQTTNSSSGLGEVGGCLFLLIIGGIIITLVVGWVRRQESLSESLGEAAGKVAKPVKQEWESLKKGFNEERN